MSIFSIFSIDDLTSEECVVNFRFEKDDIVRIKNLLRLPDIIQTTAGQIQGLEGMMYDFKSFLKRIFMFNVR